VQLMGKGYVVVPVVDKLPADIPAGLHVDMSESRTHEPALSHPLSRIGCIDCSVRNTFIHFCSPVAPERCRAKSVPKDFCSAKYPLDFGNPALLVKDRYMECSNSDIDTSAGDVSCDVSESSGDVHDMHIAAHFHAVKAVAAGLQQEKAPRAAAWRRSPSVQRHEQHEDDDCQFAPCFDLDTRDQMGRAPGGLRTPSPSPPPSIQFRGYQGPQICASFIPMTCVFVAPYAQVVCLADCI